MKVLVIEDDEGVGSALGAALSACGHTWKRCGRGADALLHHRAHDILLLDMGLPDIDGFEVLVKLRAVSSMPVIVLTGRDTERDVVRALHLGADDYLVKPLRASELLARIGLVTRRRVQQPVASAPPADVSGLEVDLAARSVRCGGRDVPFTRTEFDVFAALYTRAGEAVSREQIMDEVWGDTFDSTSKSLSVHLTQLRAKLGDRDLITTIRGHGYRLGGAAGQPATV